MKYIYTATFTEENGTVYARVPDLPGCITTGKDLRSAMELIADAASLWLVVAEDNGDPIAPPTPQRELRLPPGAQCSLIQLDTTAYRARTDSRAVRKNVSLPAWMARAAERYEINCSQLLQAALMAEIDTRGRPLASPSDAATPAASPDTR